ncbi:PA4780 family RIO1-like protein kinase [Rheinheimera salexigens]|uniref:non-specific serine/threonine protein kinase n=1 Tax=Rheinheimera salexigens TaxID=1628148 RepID=A0A1E7Q3Q6_9GAMM|nr:PA4780 family RIO1-like protein kinase [Rheinheimera salexigens]OEY68703.1 kinase [Rheinheimera salexigens]
MKIPKRIQPLVDEGMVDEVIRPLMSGKEASVYIVRCGEDIRCAKVYKEADKRSFKQAVLYQEGRKVRSSRRARAMEKGSKFGRQQQEEIWQHTEVDALFKLSKAGVRVPEPYGCYNGVLLMELVCDDEGIVAPRLADIAMDAELAIADHATMLHYIVIMLCEGLVHGDLSEFNVLVDDQGPVVIDLPQVVDAAANNNAKWMFCRDVNNMRDYYGIYAPELLQTNYAEEIWALYEAGELTTDSVLTGEFIADTDETDVDSVLEQIKAAFAEAEERKARLAEEDE